MEVNRTIAVFMGGPSAEHDISLASGKAIQQALYESGAGAPRLITISRKERTWLQEGKSVNPREALADVDVALLALHGEWGEDGSVQALLDSLGVSYNGSGVFSSTLAMDKIRSRDIFRNSGLSVPYARAYPYPVHAKNVVSLARLIVISSHLPVVVKPAGRGSSVGISIVRHPSEMNEALIRAFAFDDRILVEDYHGGAEVSCGVLDDGTGRMVALPVAQIIPPPHKAFFDYDAKYSGETQEIIPAPLPKTVAARVQKAALTAHNALGCRHYSRTDMILADGEPIVLEVNTLPGMTPESLFPKQAAAFGIPFSGLISRFVELALRDRALA